MALNILHSEAKHGDQTKTIPLATWAGTGRKALVIASWQGAAAGSGDMGATPAPFTELLRTPRPATFRPAMLVWWADIPGGTADASLPINHGGCGFVLWVFDNADTFTVISDDGGFASSYTIPGGLAELTVAGASTNAQKTVSQTGGFTLTAPPPYYAETVGAHLQPGTGGGSLVWSGDDHYAGVTVHATEQVVQTNWTNVKPDTIVTGALLGSGLGTNVDAGDNNDGITVAAGQTLEAVDKWAADPANPSTINNIRKRVHMPADYPQGGEGYAVTYQVEDAAAAVVKAEATMPPEGGGQAGLVPGETRVFASGQLTGLSFPDGGANPQVRFKLTPTPITTLRPSGGSGVPGRLGRPRMVELFRSQGETPGGPTLTVPDRWVDPVNGSDAANGLTQQTAWRTMAHAIVATDGLGVGVGYLSGNPGTVNLYQTGGSGTSWATGMNTHYVLDGHTCTISGDFRFQDVIKTAHLKYLQFSGFRVINTVNTDGGTAGGQYGFQLQDYQNLDSSHHLIMADMYGEGFTASAFATFGSRYVKLLGCEIYDSGHWADVGGSGVTFNDMDRWSATNWDTTPVGKINGQPVDVWVEACYATGCRQKTDSNLITSPNVVTDGNAFALDYWHESNGNRETDLNNYPIRAAFINCIAHNTGGRGFSSYMAADEMWMINNLSAYGGRHAQWIPPGSGDPIAGMSAGGLHEYLVQSYPASDPNGGGKEGRLTTVHWWNNVAVAGAWMSSTAFQTFGGNVTSIDAQNNKRWGSYTADAYSSQLGTGPNFTNASLDGKVFDARPQAGSSLLNGGDLALLALCTDENDVPNVTSDFAGNPIGTSGNGHVGPYAVAS